jgi:hypothetical protein
MRKSIFLVSLMLGTLLSPVSAKADTVFSVDFADHFNASVNQSYISSSTMMAKMTGGGQYLCTSVTDMKCQQGADVQAVLPLCKSATEQYCVEALSVSSKKTADGPATPIKTIGRSAFSADPAKGLPEGSQDTLFEVPALKAAGEQSLYAVRVKTNLMSLPGVGLVATSFSASVVPYTLSTTSKADVVVKEAVDPNGKTSVTFFGGDYTCVWTENGACGKEASFPEGTTVSLTVHLANYLTTWMHGRLTEQNIVISKLSETQNKLVVTAKPLDIQGVNVKAPSDKLDAATINNFRDPNGFLPPGEITMNMESSQDGALAQFKSYEKFMGDKSGTLTSTWSFRSLAGGLFNDPMLLMAVLSGQKDVLATALASALTTNSGLGSMANKCLPQAKTLAGAILGQNSTTDSIGLVTTSAMVYDSGPPEFKNGTLDYQVAGLHYNPDGTIFSGRYDLLMNKTIAKCIYGFAANVPVYAEVQVVTADGTPRVTTAILKEDGDNLKLGVYGITFSNPTIKIKLLEVGAAKPAATPTPTPSPSASASAAATASPTPVAAPAAVVKKSISCVKGKVVKSVTAVAPKCPAGYKLKK